MNPSSFRRAAAALSLAALGFSAHAADAPAVSAVDSAFVGKVSQGGAFEVEASKLAADKATSPDVKTFAENDVADHTKVNDELKSIAAAQNLPVAATLKPMFRKKLDALGKLSGAAFDKSYISQMAAIHHKDEAIFAKEAKSGTSADWKAFADKTDQIVKGHITALGPIESSLK